MRDFPMFTTENGIASLVFREVPYRGDAYIRIQSSQSPEALLKECVDFSRAVGAERIYASGHEYLESYPFHTAIYRMTGEKAALPTEDGALFPVTQSTLERFRSLYNTRMAQVPNSSYMTTAQAKELLQKGEGYFVHDQGTLLGIGILSGNEIKALAACTPGAGMRVLLTLTSGIPQQTIILECASENKKAMALYEKAGFVPTQELSRWYRVE